MNYRDEVLRTASHPNIKTLEDKLGMGALGLAGEAGEVVDLIKKIVHHGRPLDRTQLMEELGDVYWYLEYLADALGISTNDILEANANKLRKRYPSGFSIAAANAKADK